MYNHSTWTPLENNIKKTFSIHAQDIFLFQLSRNISMPFCQTKLQNECFIIWIDSNKCRLLIIGELKFSLED